jgi:photosystem II stability/assembly factor-like uncharacterized protein
VTAGSYVTALFCLDSLHIYACGHQFILSTIDGGVNWTTYLIPSQEAYLEDIFFSDPQHGWTITKTDSIHITTDGGIYWQTVALPDYAYNNEALFFTDPAHGWLGGDCVYHTEDGGWTWELQLQGGYSVNDIHFSDRLTGWFIDHDGYIFHTTDGGTQWSIQLSNAYYIYEIAFTDDQHGWIVGYEGILWNTFNGGNTWIRTYLPTLEAYCSISAIDQDHIWVCGGSGAILKYNEEGNYPHDFNDDMLIDEEVSITDDGNNILIPGEVKDKTGIGTHIRVYSLQGALIYQGFKQEGFNFNLNSSLPGLNLDAGIYIIQLINGERVESRKVLVY